MVALALPCSRAACTAGRAVARGNSVSNTYCRTTRLVSSPRLLSHSSRRGSEYVRVQAAPENGERASDDSKTDNASDNVTTSLARFFAEAVANPLFYLVAGLLAIKLVSSAGEDYQGLVVLIAAALPVTALTALSKSSVGEQVQAALEEQLPELEKEATAKRAEWKDRQADSPFYGSDRPKWGDAPHLTGMMAGDYGFDPLGLGKDPEQLMYNYQAELLHARWAMLAVIGCLIPEALAMSGVDLGEAVWWKVGASKLNSDITLNYAGIEGFRIAGRQGIGVIAVCQLALMGGPEYARYVGIKSLEPVGVFLPGEQNYPGGTPFDPFNLSADASGFAEQSVKEIKNGRLAMIAMLGYGVQAAVTREGPLQNFVDFATDPVHNNIFKYL